MRLNSFKSGILLRFRESEPNHLIFILTVIYKTVRLLNDLIH
ncbi:hypothetical protein JCM19294_172 [Nonlabens tegetincola]|uniref:Uncharacterized protein n=1 Tax=Nonlabens tegetincola TaxID=323273 RepID=A0A090QQ77_9FLAO|nr:hypothetical protein JCM19294_172 [Nonlabens tegetincola]